MQTFGLEDEHVKQLELQVTQVLLAKMLLPKQERQTDGEFAAQVKQG